jgi:DNA-binding NtrC family response regulator
LNNILLVEDKKSMREMLSRTLRAEGFHVLEASDGHEACELYHKNWVDLVLTDLQMPGMDGIGLLRELKDDGSQVDVILMTAYGTVERAVEAMKIGALDFITKPFDTDHLLILIRRALKNRHIVRENLILKERFARKDGLPVIIGQSPAIKEAASKVERVAVTDSAALLLGESGTGKELFARAIHQLSPRKDSSFVAINCAAIPSELLESELFGYEKGAFTGAHRRKIGYFELAHRGTLFLDEIGELSPPLQGKLLRVIQEKTLQRLGGTQETPVDVRLISASNKDFEALIREGTFREDLYYRIGVVPVTIPPLRERSEDVPLLVEHLLQKCRQEMNKKGLHMDDATLSLLRDQPWKGNVRELENCIERGAILCPGDRIRADDMGISKGGSSPSPHPGFRDGQSLQQVASRAAASAECAAILQVLTETEWNKTRAAEQLKVSYKTLLTKIKDYELEKQRAG